MEKTPSPPKSPPEGADEEGKSSVTEMSVLNADPILPRDLPSSSEVIPLQPVAESSDSPGEPRKIETLYESKPVSESKRKDSETYKLLSKVPDMLRSRRTSGKLVEKQKQDKKEDQGPQPSKSPVAETHFRRSVLKHSPGASSPRTEFDEPPTGARRSTVYNPFSSFDRRVSISSDSNTDTLEAASELLPGAPPLAALPPSAFLMRPSIIETEPRRMQSAPRRLSERGLPVRKRSISVADLTKQDIAVCFFPEEPDWDDEDEAFRFISLPPSRRPSDADYPEDKDREEDKTFSGERERWPSRLVYLLALVSYSISFSNVYHFPSLVYQYGGIPFLIPYTLFTLVVAYPLHFMESSLGQYSQSGPVKVWDCAPIARGIGWSMFVLCVFLAYFYNMYAAYAVIYFARCFKAVLPWQDCDEPSATNNFTCVPRMCAHTHENHYTPAEHYFFDHVLQVSYTGEILADGLGRMMWPQVLGFFLAWIIVYFSILQSVRSIGKVVFCLVVFPYFVLMMLLAAGFMLEGSVRGLYTLFGADFTKLLDLQIWRSAAEQVFFELGICQGTPLAYGSFCHHRNPTHIDSAIVCTVNYFTSILCAVIIFNILGALSMEMGTSVTEVIHQGPALVYVVYPEALSRVPGSRFWCVAFFLMLFSVSIGTQIAVMETIMTVIFDEFKEAYPYRWVINLLFCCGLFSIGMILCSSNGFYIVHLLNTMAGMMPRLLIAVCMVGTIVFIYGTRKFCEDIHFMIDYYPNMFLRISFFITPFILAALTIPSWVLSKPLSIMGRYYVFDAIVVGWFTVGFILIWILLGAIYWYSYCKYMGHPNKYIWRSLTVWGPRNFETRVARTEFSSDNIANYTKPWTRKSVMLEHQEQFK